MALGVPLPTLTNPITTKDNYAFYPISNSLLKEKKLDNLCDIYTNLLKPQTNIEIPNLRPYQNEGINKIIHMKKIGVFDQQRLGKTPMTLSALSQIDNITTIIIAPKSTLYSWYEECKKWYTSSVVLISGSKENRKKAYQTKAKVYIMGYQNAMIDEGLIPKANCIVVDEAHRMRNFVGQRSKYSPKTIKAIMKLSYKMEYKLALSGTPSANKSDDIFAILHFLYPKLFVSYYAFRDYYFNVEKQYINRTDTVDIITGFKPNKQQELQEFLNNTCLQRKRKDYMKWIPSVDKKTITVKLDKKERKWYNEIAETFECEELNINCPNILSQMTALRALTTKSTEKINWLLQYIEDYPEESILVLSTFTTHLENLHKLIPRSALLTGKTPAKSRKEIENNFNLKKFNILLGNIDVCKEGLKLEACETIVVLNPSLTFIDNEQVEDRFLPTTQEKAILKNKQQIINLVVENSIDEYIQTMLKNKKTEVEIINDFKKTMPRK